MLNSLKDKQGFLRLLLEMANMRGAPLRDFRHFVGQPQGPRRGRVGDEWFETEVKPRLRGECTLVRFADDALMAGSAPADEVESAQLVQSIHQMGL